MDDLLSLFNYNKAWAQGKGSRYFEDIAKVQVPKYLWIGCSDSRVHATQITGLKDGEIFVHRNVANLCPHTDFNFLSVLEFAVMILKVKHIIVCGHYGCGGIKAAMEEHHLGLVDNWLRHVRDVYASHKEELLFLPEEERMHRLVELNVKRQVLNVCHTTIVQKAWDDKHPLQVHSWVYDLHTGLLSDLNFSISGPDSLEEIYRLKLT